MARGQQQGLNAITVWMIVFVGLWLASTVFLVVLYTGQEDLRNENLRLQAAYRKVISSAEERSIELVKSAQESGPTVVGLLEDARGHTAAVATGEAADGAAEVLHKRDALLQTVRDDRLVSKSDGFTDLSYHDALARLYESFKSEHDLRQASEARTAQLETQTNELVVGSANQKNDIEARATKIGQQLEQCESDRALYRGERDKVVEELKRDFDESRKRNDADLTKERQQRGTAEKRASELQKRLAAIQERLGEQMIGPEKLATARQPDGKVLTAVPGDDVVYISLGQQNHLVLGLQFTVYSSQTGIPEDGRGKALVEVVSIRGSSSECRIVGVGANEVILEGDLVANPIYDPQRTLTFVVVGEFDLDRDGVHDRGRSAVLESRITSWGGQVTQELTPLTDFVVLGGPPKRPKVVEGGVADPKDPDRAVWNRYQGVAEQARALSVPILTQDVFLSFLGDRGGRLAGGP